MANKPRISKSVARQPRSSKEVVAQLLSEFKNVEKAAEVCRIGSTTLDEYANTNKEHRHMPIDVVCALENAIQRPIVSAWLVRQLGYEACEIVETSSTGDWRHSIAKIIKEGSEVFSVSSTAIENGKISLEQAIIIAKELDEAIGAFASYRQSLEILIQKHHDDRKTA